MKFNEMTYTRPDIGALLARCKELAAKAAAAPDGDALVRLYYEQSEAFAEYNTAANLANIHYTCDTRDAYWKAEQDFFDANGPAVTNASVEISRAFLANPHVDVLTAKFGTTCVAGMKNAVLGMDDRTVELQQQFNALVSRYQQIYGGALVELDGKQLTIPQLGPYKEDLDPAVRRAAYEAEAGYFDAHRAELDELYGEIVKNLNAQARVMGYHDYSELSYVRMNRIGYGPEEIRKFRDQVANDVVPQLQKVMAMRAKRTGIARPTFTDLPIMFKDGNPKPIPGYKARMDAARTMYHELSPETAEFIDFMHPAENRILEKFFLGHEVHDTRLESYAYHRRIPVALMIGRYNDGAFFRHVFPAFHMEAEYDEEKEIEYSPYNFVSHLNTACLRIKSGKFFPADADDGICGLFECQIPVIKKNGIVGLAERRNSSVAVLIISLFDIFLNAFRCYILSGSSKLHAAADGSCMSRSRQENLHIGIGKDCRSYISSIKDNSALFCLLSLDLDHGSSDACHGRHPGNMGRNVSCP